MICLPSYIIYRQGYFLLLSNFDKVLLLLGGMVVGNKFVKSALGSIEESVKHSTRRSETLIDKFDQ